MIPGSGTAEVLAHDNLIQNIPDLSGIRKVRLFSLDVRNIKDPIHCRVTDRIMPLIQHLRGNIF